MANLVSRFWRFMTGWLHSEQSRLESTKPEVVYDQALRDQRKKYKQMEEAVAGLVYNRNRLNQDLESAREQLQEVQAMLEQAVIDAQSDDKAAAEEAIMVGSMLQEQEESLLKRVAELSESRDAANVRIEEYQSKLVEFQGRIKQLEEEKANAIAQAKVDRETIRINRELTGMAVDDDSQALHELREKIGRLHAQASMTEEMQGKSLEERVRQYKLRTRSETARNRFLARVDSSKALPGESSDERPQLPSSDEKEG